MDPSWLRTGTIEAAHSENVTFTITPEASSWSNLAAIFFCNAKGTGHALQNSYTLASSCSVTYVQHRVPNLSENNILCLCNMSVRAWLTFTL